MSLTVGQLKLTGSLGRGLVLAFVNAIVFWDVPVGAVWPPVTAQVPPEEALLCAMGRQVLSFLGILGYAQVCWVPVGVAH